MLRAIVEASRGSLSFEVEVPEVALGAREEGMSRRDRRGVGRSVEVGGKRMRREMRESGDTHFLKESNLVKYRSIES